MKAELVEALTNLKSGLKNPEEIEMVQLAIERGQLSLDETMTIESIQTTVKRDIEAALTKKSLVLDSTIDTRLTKLLGETVSVQSHRRCLYTIMKLLT